MRWGKYDRRKDPLVKAYGKASPGNLLSLDLPKAKPWWRSLTDWIKRFWER